MSPVLSSLSVLQTFEGHDASVLKIIFVSRGAQLLSRFVPDSRAEGMSDLISSTERKHSGVQRIFGQIYRKMPCLGQAFCGGYFNLPPLQVSHGFHVAAVALLGWDKLSRQS